MSHWTTRYLGTPYVPGESDCWSFARRVWCEQFGIEVPVVDLPDTARDLFETFATHPARAAWAPADGADEGNAVLMGRGHKACHVGIWVNPARVLHALERQGVVLTPIDRLPTLGYRILGVWRRL